MTQPIPPSDEQTEVHRRIAARLAKLASSDPDVPPHSYVRRHLTRHAELGAVLNDHHVPTAFLPWETSGSVRGRLGLPVIDQPEQRGLAAWARIEPFLGDADLPSRASSHQLALAAGTASADQPVEAVSNSRLRPRLTRWQSPGNVVGDAQSLQFAMAVFPGPGGRTLLASAGDDCTVRVWDPLAGTPIGEPLTGHADWVWAVAAFTAPDGRTLLATASSDCTVRLWDPLAGAPVGEPLTGHIGGVLAVATFTAPDGRTLLATGGDDRTVRIWDPLAG
ncbi:WD40 repeat domain-containing protein, partial [Streptomyces sp. NPDC088733]|uniref:WD40 repeat domain-containing protein n=1 Tax=Streptomyces sp. NPDC088733 TaxID=3365880 RepID=UPI0037F222B6